MQIIKLQLTSSSLLNSLVDEIFYYLNQEKFAYVIAQDDIHKRFLESPHILSLLMQSITQQCGYTSGVEIVYGLFYRHLIEGRLEPI